MTLGTQAIQKLWFEPVAGPEVEGFWLEAGAEILIGRGSQCDLQLHEATISRQHSRFISNENGCCIIDLGSRLGTFVNEEKCEKDDSVFISTGDMVQIGPFVFRASVREGAPMSMQTALSFI